MNIDKRVEMVMVKRSNQGNEDGFKYDMNES